MRLIAIAILITILTACSSLKGMNEQHTAERKQLRIEQKEKKKELGEKHKIEAKKLQKRLEIERELLKAKQAIQLVEYGSEKFKELSELIKHLENLLK